MFRDVFREVGLLEVLVTCLHRYAALLKDPEAATDGRDNDNIIESDDDASLSFDRGGRGGGASQRGSKVPEAQQVC